MELSKLITVNRRIDVTAAEEKRSNYRSVIQETAQDTFSIDVPTNKKVPWIPSNGELVLVGIVAEDARYEFEAGVLEKKRRPLPLIVLRNPNPENVKRVQLREHFRVPIVIGVNYRELQKEEWKDYRILEADKKGTALDISGGGMRLVVDSPVASEDRLLLRFKLAEREYCLLGRVGRVQEQLLPNKIVYALGLSFEQITSGEEDDIVSFCFRRQLKGSKAKD